ncbi:UNC-50 [Usnea florida]
MNPHISIPRQHGGTPSFGAATPAGRSEGLRMPRFFKRLFKFPQMDFEMAIWEMTSLLIAPKKVFRSIYYHKRTPHFPPPTPQTTFPPLQTLTNVTRPPETKNTWHRPDPSFTYLLSFFMLLTGIAWGIAYTTSVSATVRLTLLFVFVHFLTVSLVVATTAFFLVGRLLGPGIAGLPGRRRQQGLFTQAGEGEQLEFGYCFDVAIRAFFPVWVWLYVLQFLLWPLIARDNCFLTSMIDTESFLRVSTFFGNTLYLVALGYYTIICFLGYNALPFLHHTELLLSPCFVYAILWFASLFGFNIAKHVGPLLITGAG